MTFNLPAPPNFRGLDESLPIHRYVRHLPHWRQDGATYFVTLNLEDALPANKQSEIDSMRREWEHKHPPPRNEKSWVEYAKTVYQIAEKALDAGFGKCWFRNSL
jgi:hypothetical protein